MKHNTIFILTMAILGSIYPFLSNIRTEATEAQISDAENVSIVSEAPEVVEKNEEKTIEIDAKDAITFAEITAEEAPVVSEPVVEKTVIVEQKPVVEEKPVYVAPAANPEPTYVAPAPAPAPAPEPEPVYVAPATQPDHIEVAGRWVNVYNVDSTALDAGNSVYRFINTAKGYDGRFLYGHNSNNVFGGLKNLSVGSTFTVTLDNNTVTYRVSSIVIFEKNQETGKLMLNGTGSYMNNVARAKHDGVQYDLSLMTCHGQSLGHGDATHRLVVFASRI